MIAKSVLFLSLALCAVWAATNDDRIDFQEEGSANKDNQNALVRRFFNRDSFLLTISKHTVLGICSVHTNS